MGVFSRGSKRLEPLDAAIARALADVESGRARGQSAISVQVHELPVGHGRLSDTLAAVSNALQQAGYSVTGVDRPDWGSFGHVNVLLGGSGAAPAGRHDHGLAAERISAGTLVEAVKSAVSRYREWFSDPADSEQIWFDRDVLEMRLRQERPQDAAGYDAFLAQLGPDWFWVNAFPAFVGLHLEHRESPGGVSVFQYAGDADAAIDRGNPHMVNLMNEIDRRARNSL